MSWTGSICDQETARKAAGSVLMGQTQFSVLSGSLTTVATAQAAAATNSALMSICDRELLASVQRGYKIASDMGGTFGSTYAALYASLPDTGTHQRAMINS